MKLLLRGLAILHVPVTGLSLFLAVGAAQAEPPPVLWGSGVQSCKRLVQASDGTDQGVEADIIEYGRIQAWLAGFVSGLNLATDRDVLNGLAVSAAMRQIEAECREDPQRDLFSTTLGLVRESMQFDQLLR
ncbi:hypothetical protein Thimo_1938 [Thioflavicoccus mobilis 8321]|uniref:HdeA/HdeB family protein n=1 Tax=Thioflavicoccus mobilis 8321 TaxID=765912 RepID=L0GVC1_9GAMM|nr:hypothetical protein [Thioflavicoccus mobilis]AGA90703.1 hypothetical protein Thimo_1938 [Thioflavicoccus mobilis 8321]